MKKIIIWSILLVALVSSFIIYKLFLLDEYEVNSNTFVVYDVIELERKILDNSRSYSNYKDLYFMLPNGKYNLVNDDNNYDTYKCSDDINNITVKKLTSEEITGYGMFDEKFINYIFKKHEIETEYDLFLARMEYENQNISLFSSANDIKERNFFYVYDVLQGDSVIYQLKGDLNGKIKYIETESGSMYEIKLVKYYTVYEIKILKSDMSIEDVIDFSSSIYFKNEIES